MDVDTSTASSVATAGRAAPRREYRFEIVMVAYHSRDLIERYLAQLPVDVPVVVVDNSHDVDGLSEVAEGRPGTRVLDGPGRGFAAGANRAVLASRKPILVVVDPDASPTVEQIDELVADLDADPNLGIVSVTTVMPDGSVEIGVGGWEATVGRALVHAVGAHKVFPRAGLFARPTPGEPLELDWLGGACMAIPRAVYDRVGLYDEDYFVYSEDVEFSRRVRESGMRLALRTDILVTHLSTGSGDPRPRMVQQRGASMMMYLSRHNPQVVAWAIGGALTAGYLARSVACRLTRQPGRALEHVAYVKGLWLGPQK